MMSPRVHDGCYAWVVCGASFLSNVLQGGYHYAIGVLYIMLQENLNANDSEIALVTSLSLGIFFVSCTVAGILTVRFGERNLAMVGSAIATVGLASSSLATEIWHLYITYSLVSGIGMAMAYNPSITVLARHFDKHRTVAVGVAMCGVGVGSFAFPPIIKALKYTYGWRGTFLMMGAIYSHAWMFGISGHYASSFYLAGILYGVAGSIMIFAIWHSRKTLNTGQEYHSNSGK